MSLSYKKMERLYASPIIFLNSAFFSFKVLINANKNQPEFFGFGWVLSDSFSMQASITILFSMI